MMKWLFLFLLSFSLIAAPKVGDFAEYDLVISQAGQTVTGSYTQEIVGIDSAKIEVFISTSIMGDVTNETLTYSHEDFLGADAGKEMIQYCQYLGLLENMVIAGQSHQVCKITGDANGMPNATWLGNFPFAMAKYEGHDQGAKVISILRSFKFGN